MCTEAVLANHARSLAPCTSSTQQLSPCMCRPLPEAVYGEQSKTEPLLGVRRGIASPELGETLDSLPLLERLLRCQHEPAHEAISACLWGRCVDSMPGSGWPCTAAAGPSCMQLAAVCGCLCALPRLAEHAS